MVGTAVYQLALHSSIQPKNFSALKPGVQNTELPADKGARTPAISPWIWNRGMMLSPTSVGSKRVVARILWAEAQTLRWRKGTILGREVVPDVCSTRAMSSGSA